jgi:hypothetical protein
MRSEKRSDLLGLMRREVVDDDMDGAPPRLRLDHGREKCHELIARVPRDGVAEDFAGVPCR